MPGDASPGCFFLFLILKYNFSNMSMSCSSVQILKDLKILQFQTKNHAIMKLSLRRYVSLNSRREMCDPSYWECTREQTCCDLASFTLATTGFALVKPTSTMSIVHRARQLHQGNLFFTISRILWSYSQTWKTTKFECGSLTNKKNLGKLLEFAQCFSTASLSKPTTRHIAWALTVISAEMIFEAGLF